MVNKNFLPTLKLISKTRETKNAPVDIYGPHAISEIEFGEKVYRYQVLIALMLSSQTKDEVTANAIKKLQQYGLKPENIDKLSLNNLNELIKKVGFHNRKADYIKKTTNLLLNKYNGDIPNTLEALIALPGVGYKMAILAMNIAWKINCGISVDTHVHRISNRLGWINTLKPEQTRKELEDWIPKEYWASINPILVGFGQQICLPKNPKCQLCPVNKYCMYYDKIKN